MLQFDTVGTSVSAGDDSSSNHMVMDENADRSQKLTSLPVRNVINPSFQQRMQY